AGQQEGTLHFQHLKNVNGGLLTVAATLDEHCAQLHDAVRRGLASDPRSRAFIEAFVRPYGIDQPAADRFVAAVEAEAARRPAPRRAQPIGAALLRPVLAPMAVAATVAQRRRRARRRADGDGPRRPLKLMFVVGSAEYI